MDLTFVQIDENHWEVHRLGSVVGTVSAPEFKFSANAVQFSLMELRRIAIHFHTIQFERSLKKDFVI